MLYSHLIDLVIFSIYYVYNCDDKFCQRMKNLPTEIVILKDSFHKFHWSECDYSMIRLKWIDFWFLVFLGGGDAVTSAGLDPGFQPKG